MKLLRNLAPLLVLLVTGAPPAGAQVGMGIGAIVGEPTGLTSKTWLTPKTAFDLAVGWSFVDEDAFHLHADYLIHDYGIFPVQRGALPLYYGVGARLKAVHEDTVVGIRAPLGVDYLLATKPLGVFLEIVPVVDVTPRTDLSLNASFGIRYFLR
jgi:hypothetical protein